MVLQASNSYCQRKPTWYPTAWKMISHHTTYVMKTINVRPCDVQNLIKSLKLRTPCRSDSIPNEFLRHLPRRLLIHLTHLFNHCCQLSHFPSSWNEVKVITLSKPELTTDKQIAWESYPKNIPKTRWRKYIAECAPVWISYTSQHDTSMHETYGPRDPKIQKQYVHGCGFLGYRKSL
jgi:hypothetical protein